MNNDHFHVEFAPGWLLEDPNQLSCGACPQHRLVQVNLGPTTLRFTFESFQSFSHLMQRMAEQISAVDKPPVENGKVISGVFSRKEH